MSQQLQPGTHVTSAIRLSHQLGAGGMGSVWIADHLGLNNQVVVKFMTDALVANQEAIARFKREAASASSVRSPHVVQMHDYGIAPNGSPFIVMELLEGEDLRHRLERTQRLPPSEVAAIIAQAAKALGRAHDRGVVHRDIKPDNIFLCDAGHGDVFVKVLDFGIAKTSDAQGFGATKTGAMLGTPYYMSPEQVMGAKTIDHRTDLWSLGIVAYEALTGARPFDAETIGALSIAIVHGSLPLPTHVNQALPPAIDAWFQRACAREPSDRFANARELADALDAAVSGRASMARSSAETPTPAAISAAPSPIASTPVQHGPAMATLMMTTTSASSMAGPTDGVPPVAPPARRSAARLFVAIGTLVLLGAIGGVAAFVVGSRSQTAVEPAAAKPAVTESASEKAKKSKPGPIEPATESGSIAASNSTSAQQATAAPAPPPTTKTQPTTTVPKSPSAPKTTATPAAPKPPNDPNIF